MLLARFAFPIPAILALRFVSSLLRKVCSSKAEPGLGSIQRQPFDSKLLSLAPLKRILLDRKYFRPCVISRMQASLLPPPISIGRLQLFMDNKALLSLPVQSLRRDVGRSIRRALPIPIVYYQSSEISLRGERVIDD